ncbi:MAG: hypothetical protein HQL41_19010 [Alphaproteobacteria bacterium]|nr:hypothetical protein [Alphaproteobacteria bacterium]
MSQHGVIKLTEKDEDGRDGFVVTGPSGNVIVDWIGVLWFPSRKAAWAFINFLEASIEYAKHCADDFEQVCKKNDDRFRELFAFEDERAVELRNAWLKRARLFTEHLRKLEVEAENVLNGLRALARDIEDEILEDGRSPAP